MFSKTLLAALTVVGLTGVLAGGAQASPVLLHSYDSGVTAAIGEGGAADPVDQAWVLSSNGTLAGHAYAADGGFRTVDAGTGSGALASFNYDLNPHNAALQT
ncbi:MAG: hypothetical protein WD079_06290, partial [Phycisphaeraceae bacterium]